MTFCSELLNLFPIRDLGCRRAHYEITGTQASVRLWAGVSSAAALTLPFPTASGRRVQTGASQAGNHPQPSRNAGGQRRGLCAAAGGAVREAGLPEGLQGKE